MPAVLREHRPGPQVASVDDLDFVLAPGHFLFQGLLCQLARASRHALTIIDRVAKLPFRGFRVEFDSFLYLS